MYVPPCLPSVPLLSSKALEKYFPHLVDLIACNSDDVSLSFAHDLIQLKLLLIPGWDGLQVLRKPGLGFKMFLVSSRNGLRAVPALQPRLCHGSARGEEGTPGLQGDLLPGCDRKG